MRSRPPASSPTPPSARPPALLDRRGFLTAAGSCCAHVMAMAAASTLPARRLFAAPVAEVVAEQPWARVERIGEGVWSVVSTPLGGDFTTVCNGGLVAGGDRVLAIDSYVRPAGARWVAEVAERLTGRRPTDVILSHFHGDHVGGLGGFLEGGAVPRVWATRTTRDLALGAAADGTAEQRRALEGVELLSLDEPTSFRLGGRAVVVTPRAGHTDSDVTVEVQDPRIVFFGDLVWNRMFPNYMSATPSALSVSVREAVSTPFVDYVPGHGPRATRQELSRYLDLLDDVEQAARRAHEKGVSAADAAKTYSLPEAIADWTLFSPDYFEVALGAWLKELG